MLRNVQGLYSYVVLKLWNRLYSQRLSQRYAVLACERLDTHLPALMFI